MRRGVTGVEAAIVTGLIGAFLGVAVLYEHQVLRQARELALQADLQSLRAGIKFFEAQRGHLPRALDDALVQPFGALSARGGGSSPRNRAGALVDAFEHPYRYDARTGEVISTTPGYQEW